MFDIDRFVADCISARRGPDHLTALRALLQGAVDDRAGLQAAFADDQDEEKLVFRGPDLTLVHVRLSPNTLFPPHNHHMHALIGAYEGREIHREYRRQDGALFLSGGSSLIAGQIAECDIPDIHAVGNCDLERSAALHIYVGDLIGMRRQIWHPDTHEAAPYSDETYFGWSRAYDPDLPFVRPAVCHAHAPGSEPLGENVVTFGASTPAR